MSKTAIRSDRTYKIILEQMKDPIRLMILIKILRQPDITSNELKRDLLIPGTKIFYYLKQLSSMNPPLIYESETEKVKDHLIRRKFRVTSEMIQILHDYFDPNENSKEYRLYELYVSAAILQQQIRETLKANTKKELDAIGTPMLMYVDNEIAKELKTTISSTFKKCYAKYQNVDRIEAIRACEYGAFAGIYPMK